MAAHPSKARLFALLPVLALALAGYPLWGHAQNTAADFSQGSVGIGYDNRACDSSLEGTIRYSSGAPALQFCDGTNWKNL